MDTKNKKKKRKKYFIIILGFCILIIGVIIIKKNCFNKKNVQNIYIKNKFYNFAENWNEILFNLEIKNRKDYLLNKFNDKEIILKLNNIFRKLNYSFSQDALKELRNLKNNKKDISIYLPIIEYMNDFIKINKKIKITKKIFEISMQEDELYNLYKKILGEELNYDSLKTIIGLQSFCNYFYLNLEKLYKRGMTKNFFSCNDAIQVLKNTGKVKSIFSEIEIN